MLLVESGGPVTTMWRGRRARRRADADRYLYAAELRDRWRWVAEGTAIARSSPCVAGGVVVSVPDVVTVNLGPPVVLTVRLLAGQLVDDLAAAGRRLAEGMGVAAVRVERSRYFGFATVTLLPVDPLAAAAGDGFAIADRDLDPPWP
jgi:hypothetical protein